MTLAAPGRRALAAVVFLAGGLLLLLAGLLLALWYFHWNDRVLFVWPSLAEQTTIESIVRQTDRHDNRWVQVPGRLWRRRSHSAVLVPTGAGEELLSAGGFRPLPEPHLLVEFRGFGASRNVSLRDPQPVTILGRLHRGEPGRGPWINIGAIREQRDQGAGRISVVLYSVLALVLIGAGLAATIAGLRILWALRRSA